MVDHRMSTNEAIFLNMGRAMKEMNAMKSTSMKSVVHFRGPFYDKNDYEGENRNEAAHREMEGFAADKRDAWTKPGELPRILVPAPAVKLVRKATKGPTKALLAAKERWRKSASYPVGKNNAMQKLRRKQEWLYARKMVAHADVPDGLDWVDGAGVPFFDWSLRELQSQEFHGNIPIGTDAFPSCWL